MKQINQIELNELQHAIDYLEALHKVITRDKGKTAPEYVDEKIRRAKRSLDHFEAMIYNPNK